MVDCVDSETEIIIEYPDYKNYANFLNNQYKTTIQNFSPVEIFNINSRFRKNNPDVSANSFFNTRAIKLPKFKIEDSSFSEYRRFEDFTSKDEVNNLSLWTLACIKHLSNDNDSQFGKELHIPLPDNPRDARLDVVSRDGDQILIFESKVNLFSALSEGRFKSQIPNYYSECKRITKEFNLKDHKNYNINIFLLIGGEETDLYPSDHPDCTTGQSGEISNTFYDILQEYKIKFVSANSLWALLAYSTIKKKRLRWSEILTSLFADSSTIGLLSGGKVTLKEGSISVEKFDL
jgi:hypothetical protein